MSADELEASRREIPRTKIATDGEGRLIVAWRTRGGRWARSRFHRHDTVRGKRQYCLLGVVEPVGETSIRTLEPTLASVPRTVRRAVATPTLELRGPCEEDHVEIDDEDDAVENMEGFA